MIKETRMYKNDNWLREEFHSLELSDERLKKRLIKIMGDFYCMPETSINVSSGSWAESKAAYRFFQNENVDCKKILSSHVKKTVQRFDSHQTILAIQDTSYISYKTHTKTKDLGLIASRIRSKTTNFKTYGLVMHTTFAVTPQGLPIGLLDQKIYARPVRSDNDILSRKNNNLKIPISDKESIRWLNSLENSVGVTCSNVIVDSTASNKK